VAVGVAVGAVAEADEGDPVGVVVAGLAGGSATGAADSGDGDPHPVISAIHPAIASQRRIFIPTSSPVAYLLIGTNACRTLTAYP